MLREGTGHGKSDRLLWQLILFFILNSSFLYSSQFCTLNGKIIDSLTSRPLRQVTVELSGSPFGAISDSNGNYSIKNLPFGIYDIKISLIGYRTIVERNLNIETPYITLNFRLNETPAIIADVVVKPKHNRDNFNEYVGSSRLDHDVLKKITGNLEDVFRSVSVLPGVAQVNNYHNDLIVQGGGPAENLFIIDGMEVSNINHFGNQTNSGGVISFINMDYVKSVSFSSGGFSSLYGDKISSAMEINLQDGNKDHLRGKAVVSATQFALNADGPVSDNTGFIISARRSYLDMVFKLYGFNFAPEYYDFFARVNSRIDNKNSLSFLFIGVLDKIKFFNVRTNEIYENPRALGSNQKHFLGGLSYKNVFNKGFFNVSLSRNVIYSEAVSNLIYSNSSDEVENNFKMDLVVKFNSENELDLGAQTKLINFNSAFKMKTFSTTFNEDLKINYKETRNDYLKSGVYAQYNRLFGNRLKLNLGLRADFFDGTNEDYSISPRFFTEYFFSENSSFSLSLGIYRQTPEYLWIAADPQNKNLKSITSRQMHLEFEERISRDFDFKIGSFIKKYSDYPVSLLRPYLVMANAGAGFSGVDDNFAGSGLDPMISQGEGMVKGLTLLVRKSNIQDPLWGILSLTYSESEFQGLDKIRRPGSFDQRWNLVITAGYILNENWELGTKFSFATGTPFTPFNEKGQQDPANYNSTRIEDMHSFDIRIDRKWNLNDWKLRTYLDIQNIYNHKVRTLFIWDKKHNKIADEPILGIVPSVGISLEF